MLRLQRLWSQTRRGVMYVLLLLLFLLMQNVVLSHVSLLGVRAMFVPALVVAVGHFEGGWRGGVFGLAAGEASDLSGTSPALLFTVLFPVMGFLMGFLTEFLINRRFYAYCVAAVGALFLSAFAQMFRLLVAYPDASGALWGTCLLQTLWSVPFLFPAYYACQALPRRLQ